MAFAYSAPPPDDDAGVTTGSHPDVVLVAEELDVSSPDPLAPAKGIIIGLAIEAAAVAACLVVRQLRRH